MEPTLEPTRDCAREFDRADPLAHFRDEFEIPKGVYLLGNSLGLMPRRARGRIDRELDRWAKLGIGGHFSAEGGDAAWLDYPSHVLESLARVVGAKPAEVTAMNALSVNLHLLMASFYRPTRQRYRIVIEEGAFPSDRYAVASQARWHGFDPAESILELKPRAGEATLRTQDILDALDRNASEIALVLLGSVQYRTGQAFDLAAISQKAHAIGAMAGFDLAHGAGNLALQLHDWGPDFAVWCSYKYLNAGPGAVGGAFVHERHHGAQDLPRLEGWFGHERTTRMAMLPGFRPEVGAQAWQMSNAPVFSIAALRASLDLFDEAGMAALRAKSEKLTGYLELLVDRRLAGRVEIITPRAPSERGCHLSLRLLQPGIDAEAVARSVAARGVLCDVRPPGIIRVAPVPFYNRFEDVFQFAEALEEVLGA